jgi:hypothetical protein
MSYYNPYWNKALQNQTRAQNKPQVKPETRQASKRQRVRDGFDDEWVGKEVEGRVVEGANVVTLRGKIIDVSRYWLKMAVDGQTLYVNKAYVVSIKPVEMKDGAPGGPNAGAGGQSARQ